MKMWEVTPRRQAFNRAVYQARYDFRCDTQKARNRYFDERIVIDGIADIAHLRLQQAMLPLTDALDRFIHSVTYLERSI